MPESTLFVSLVLFVAGLAVGTATGMIFQWGLHRRVLRTEMDVADLQESLLSEKRKRAINTRWQNPTNEQQLMELLQSRKKTEVFDNDPIG